MRVRDRIIGKRCAATLPPGRRSRKTWLAQRPRVTHISSGVRAVARVPRRERGPARTWEVVAAAEPSRRARSAEVSPRGRSCLSRAVVVGAGSPGRWCWGWAWELGLLIEEKLLGGSRPVGRKTGHLLWLLRCPPRHPKLFSKNSRCRSLCVVPRLALEEWWCGCRSFFMCKLCDGQCAGVVTLEKVTQVTLVCGR